MKGYELIVVVNGLLFLFIGLFGFANGAYLEQKGARCVGGDAEQCQREITIGSTVRTAAMFVAPIGILLLGTGGVLVLRRRARPGSAPLEPDA